MLSIKILDNITSSPSIVPVSPGTPKSQGSFEALRVDEKARPESPASTDKKQAIEPAKDFSSNKTIIACGSPQEHLLNTLACDYQTIQSVRVKPDKVELSFYQTISSRSPKSLEELPKADIILLFPTFKNKKIDNRTLKELVEDLKYIPRNTSSFNFLVIPEEVKLTAQELHALASRLHINQLSVITTQLLNVGDPNAKPPLPDKTSIKWRFIGSNPYEITILENTFYQNLYEAYAEAEKHKLNQKHSAGSQALAVPKSPSFSPSSQTPAVPKIPGLPPRHRLPPLVRFFGSDLVEHSAGRGLDTALIKPKSPARLTF